MDTTRYRLPFDGCGLVSLGSERVGQWSVLHLAVVSRRVEVVEAVLGHLVVARSQTELRRAHARNVAAIAWNRSFRLLLPRLCIYVPYTTT